jgi:hypothetical protein
MKAQRVFSELGDLLEPRRLKMKPATISAIQCTRAWGSNLGKIVSGYTSTVGFTQTGLKKTR